MKHFLFLIFAITLLTLAGCGDEKPPPPPTAHAVLVKKLFDNLEKNQRDAALKRIQKVRALDPGNDFLVQMEEREYCNLQILEAQKQLDANQIGYALSIIEEAKKKYPLNRNLMAVEEELKMLQTLKGYIKLLNVASSSDQMNIQISRISAIIKKYPPAKILEPMLRQKMKLADLTRLAEEKHARFDLLCDLKAASCEKQRNLLLEAALRAMLSAANDTASGKNEHVKSSLLD